MGKKILVSLLIVILALAFLGFSGHDIPVIDRHTDEYFSQTTAEAALAYAAVRGVNAAVSVLKESQVELSPAGVGLNIAVGQVLDPIDDMTERLSSVLVTALVSLGLQKLILEISQSLFFPGLAVASLFLLAPLWLSLLRTAGVLSLLIRICSFLLVLRLLLPLSSLINQGLYQNLLKDEIIAAKQNLSVISSEQVTLGGFDDQKPHGIKPSFSQATREKIEQVRSLYNQIAEHGDEIIEALLKLTTLYVSLFILQVIVIPVGVLWLLILFTNASFRSVLMSRPAGPGTKAGPISQNFSIDQGPSKRE